MALVRNLTSQLHIHLHMYLPNSTTDVSDHSPSASKPAFNHIEQIHTNEQVPGHTNYYEKDGLRTAGDGEDHDAEQPMNFKRLMALVAMAFRAYSPSQTTDTQRSSLANIKNSMDRQPNPRLPLRRRPPLHLRRHRRHRPLDLVYPGKPPLPRRRVPLRRFHLRHRRPPVGRHDRRVLPDPRHDYLLNRTFHEYLHCRNGV